jgi:hypothetical protein
MRAGARATVRVPSRLRPGKISEPGPDRPSGKKRRMYNLLNISKRLMQPPPWITSIRRFASAGWKSRGGALMVMGVLVGCTQHRNPPSSMSFDGLPISGSLADARRAGFSDCIADNVSMRCRRNGVRLEGRGPFNAAVDLDGSDGSGGFDQLTLWHDQDQDALSVLVDELKRRGWKECFGGGRWGDQAIYTRKGSPVFASMDLSYWSKRRLRVIPMSRKPATGC